MEWCCSNVRCRKVLELDESLYELEIDFASFKQPKLQNLLDALQNVSEGKERRSTLRLQGIQKLFEMSTDLCSPHTELPLCKECATKHLKSLEQQLNEGSRENQSYETLLQQLTREVTDVNEEDLIEEIRKLEEEEKSIKETLYLIENETTKLNKEYKELQTEETKIEEIEQRYWYAFNEFQRELQGYHNEYDTIEMKLVNAKEQIDKYKITDVYNDTFHIWHEGHFGTINGFRLGRLPSQPVDWNEINAAWGQATLLLYTIAKKCNFKFSTYRLLPIGSASKMERISDRSTYELYGSSDISLGRLFWYRRFDYGMAAFLGCLKEMGEFVENQDKSFKLPYRIDKDKVGDMSIRIQFNNEETWTKALKYMLTNLKYLLVWLTKG